MAGMPSIRHFLFLNECRDKTAYASCVLPIDAGRESGQAAIMRTAIAHDRIEISALIAAPQDRVWRLLTDMDHIRVWWGDHVKLDARPGGTLREIWSDGGREVVTAGIVKQFVPPRLLSMSWADHDWPGDTQVRFSLDPIPAGTQLLLIHSGWSVHPAERISALVEAHAQGWASHLERLARLAQEPVTGHPDA